MEKIGIFEIIEGPIKTRTKSGRSRTQYRVRCTCGNEFLGYSDNLNRQQGCIKCSRAKSPKTFVGKKYGKLTVLKYYKLNKKKKYECLCECGNKTFTTGSNLVRGYRCHCGCSPYIPGTNTKKPLGIAVFNGIVYSYKQHAKKKNINCELTNDEFAYLFQQNCFYCGCKPSTTQHRPNSNGSYTYNGIDRVDNNKGYTIDNCVTCCKTCNFQKRNLIQEEFLEWIKKIYENRFGT